MLSLLFLLMCLFLFILLFLIVSFNFPTPKLYMALLSVSIHSVNCQATFIDRTEEWF